MLGINRNRGPAQSTQHSGEAIFNGSKQSSIRVPTVICPCYLPLTVDTTKPLNANVNAPAGGCDIEAAAMQKAYESVRKTYTGNTKQVNTVQMDLGT